MTPEQEYRYPADRNKRPEDVEDVGMFPPPQPAKDNPLAGLARRKPAAPAQPTPIRSIPAAERPVPTPPDPATGTPTRRDIHRGSTAMLPASLVAAVDQKRMATNLSAGSIVVEAIEAHYDDLQELLQDGSVSSTAGFRTREKIRDPNKEKTTIFAYRLSGEDFATLDRLVADLGARDRTHLMRTALTAYFKEAP